MGEGTIFMQPARYASPLRQLFPRTRTLSAFFHRHTHTRASDKLFADAAREEAEGSSEGAPKSHKPKVLEQEHENWTGDENIKDAVLRMLVDKYKPLRGPGIITAEQRIKQSPPKVWHGTPDVSSAPPASLTEPRSGSWANEPLLPSSDTHKPWETTFKAPSHDVMSIKAAVLPPPVAGGKPGAATSLRNVDERKAKEGMKRVQQAGRLGRALESTLDYKLGIKHKHGFGGRPNPASLKGWNTLIEDKIEKARSAGMFKNVKGRGQPLARSTDEANPFIAREEFLMNRIVQRNGAAPPWVEVQGELDTAVRTFRELLRQSWTRRALRILTMNNPAELLHKVTLKEVKALRDSDWVTKEQSYHETAVAELNSLVRKHNGLAPYAVRRPYYLRHVEIERMYEVSAEDVMREIRERVQDTGFVANGENGGRPTVGSSAGGKGTLADAAPLAQDQPPAKREIRDRVWEWFCRVSSRSKQ